MKECVLVQICYENFSPTPKNFRQPKNKNFRLLQQLGGTAAPPSTPSNMPMRSLTCQLDYFCTALIITYFIVGLPD